MPRSAPAEVIWRNPPDRADTDPTFRGRTAGQWLEVLKEKPGEWAFVDAASVGHEVSKRMRALDIIVRTVKGEGVFLRTMPTGE